MAMVMIDGLPLTQSPLDAFLQSKCIPQPDPPMPLGSPLSP